MYVIQISGQDDLAEAMELFSAVLKWDEQNPLLDLRIGIDPLDNGFKVSVNGLTWSPPITGTIIMPGPQR